VRSSQSAVGAVFTDALLRVALYGPTGLLGSTLPSLAHGSYSDSTIGLRAACPQVKDESRARSVPKWIEVDRSGSRHRSVPKWHRLGTLLAQFGTLLNEVFHEGEGAK
jgi:hypothetical protein